MTRKAHRRKLADPLVPIAGDRLKLARKKAGQTSRGIARELKRRGVPAAYQTLTYVERGQQRRVRQSLFDALVALLRPPFNRWRYAKWLAGENIDPTGGLPPDWQNGPRHVEDVFFIVSRDVAVLRSVAIRERPDRATAESWHPGHLGAQLQGLYNPALWRDALLEMQSDDAGITPAEALIPPVELEAAAEHGSAFLRVVLRPWIKGRARLRPDARRRLLTTLGKLLRPRT